MHTPRILSQQPPASGALSPKGQAAFGKPASAFHAMLDNARAASHPAHTTSLKPLNGPHALKPMLHENYRAHLKAATSQRALHPLAAKDRTPHRNTDLSQHERLTRQAKKLVAQTFYGKMLKQMRQSPFKSEVFSGGRGGEAYSSLYDQQLAEHMTRGNNKLVGSIVNKLEARSQAQGSAVNKVKPSLFGK